MDMSLPFRTFADLEQVGLELYVTCQRCHRQKLIEVTPGLRGRRVAGQRFRCKGKWYDGTPCRGIGLPTIQKQRRWVCRQADYTRILAEMSRRKP
jgi:hypothetical protein